MNKQTQRLTKDMCRQHIQRGARTFLFRYPDRPDRPNAVFTPTDETQEQILNGLFSIPGCKEVGGPYINGVMDITIEDQDDQIFTDEQVMDQIATIISKNWRSDLE